MKRYERKLFAYIMRLGKVTTEEAEDILQEVFIKTYQNLNSFDPDLKFSSWIYRITYNHSISSFRKRKSRPQTLSSEDSEKVFECLKSELDIQDDLHRKFENKKLKKILDKLEKKYRDVLILKFLEDKNYKEISDILRKPMGTVATLINRAKSKFRKLLLKNNIKLSN